MGFPSISFMRNYIQKHDMKTYQRKKFPKLLNADKLRSLSMPQNKMCIVKLILNLTFEAITASVKPHQECLHFTLPNLPTV